MIEFLQKHSFIGFISGISSSALQFINDLEIVFKMIGFATGITIAFLTIYAKILEIKRIKKSKKL